MFSMVTAIYTINERFYVFQKCLIGDDKIINNITDFNSLPTGICYDYNLINASRHLYIASYGKILASKPDNIIYTPENAPTFENTKIYYKIPKYDNYNIKYVNISYINDDHNQHISNKIFIGSITLAKNTEKNFCATFESDYKRYSAKHPWDAETWPLQKNDNYPTGLWAAIGALLLDVDIENIHRQIITGQPHTNCKCELGSNGWKSFDISTNNAIFICLNIKNNNWYIKYYNGIDVSNDQDSEENSFFTLASPITSLNLLDRAHILWEQRKHIAKQLK